eukprot:12047048-Prorocentrum_lima.AAC.1
MSCVVSLMPEELAPGARLPSVGSWIVTVFFAFAAGCAMGLDHAWLVATSVQVHLAVGSCVISQVDHVKSG